ncbi:hypothetical protein KXW98_004193, partial [Aspergillus fumigatus]
ELKRKGMKAEVIHPEAQGWKNGVGATLGSASRPNAASLAQDRFINPNVPGISAIRQHR